MKERELRLSQELGKESKLKKEEETVSESNEEGYRKRIAGSFGTAKKTVPVQSDPSASRMRPALWLPDLSAIYNLVTSRFLPCALLQFRVIST